MTDPNDVVRVAAGDMVVIELYKQGLAEAGIEGRVLGEALDASFGTAIPQSVELWVHRSDAERAEAVIRQMEAERGRPARESEAFGHPEDEAQRPRKGGHGPHPHYNPDPRS
jgi:hypothetical protein